MESQKAKLNILFVIPFFAPAFDFGGPVSAAYNIARLLVKNGHSVTVYTTDTFGEQGRVSQKNEIIEGVEVRRFRNLSNTLSFKHNIYLPLLMPFEVREEIKNFDIIHLNEYRTLLNVIVQKYAVSLGIPYVIQAHGSLPRIITKQRLKALFDKYWGKRILMNASKVIAVSNLEVAQYIENGVSRDDITILPNGINLEDYNILPPKGVFRKKWGLNEKQPLVLFLARIHKIKGLDILIEAFHKLTEAMPNVKLAIAGPDHGYLNTVKNIIKSLGIEEKVIFTGALYGSEKLSAYVDADVYVLPSSYEIFGITALEACACGVPVVITDKCGISETIKAIGGRVISPNPKEIYQALLHIFELDEDNKARLKKGERVLVESEYTWSIIVNNLVKIYSDSAYSK